MNPNEVKFMMQKTKHKMKVGLAAMALAGMTSVAVPATAADSWESGAATYTISPKGQDETAEYAAATGSGVCGPLAGLCEKTLEDFYKSNDCDDREVEITILPDGVETARCL